MFFRKVEQTSFFQNIEKKKKLQDILTLHMPYYYTLVYSSFFFFFFLFAMQEAERNCPEIWMQIDRNPWAVEAA